MVNKGNVGKGESWGLGLDEFARRSPSRKRDRRRFYIGLRKQEKRITYWDASMVRQLIQKELGLIISQDAARNHDAQKSSLSEFFHKLRHLWKWIIRSFPIGQLIAQVLKRD